MTAVATKKKSAKKSKKSTKQPRWTLITFTKIEKARADLGLTKVRMAELLGVTNSTYHNWKKGTAVPHPGAQQEIVDAIIAAEEASGESGQTPANVGSKKRSTKKAGKAKPTTKKRSTKKATAGTGHINRLNGSSAVSENGGGTFHQTGRDTSRRSHDAEHAATNTDAGQTLSRPTAHKVPGSLEALVLMTYLSNPSTKVSAGSLPKLIQAVRTACA